MSRIGWRFSEETMFSLGYWYADFGDPVNERLLTLTQVVMESDNPLWCLREHGIVLRRIITAAERLLDDLDHALDRGPGHHEIPQVTWDSPLAGSLVGAHRSLQHALVLLVDAMVECRQGRLEADLRSQTGEAADLALVMADAINTTVDLGRRLPDEGAR